MTRALTLLAACAAACSFMQMKAPPSPPPPAGQPVACSDGYGSPIADTLLAGAWGAASVAVLSADVGDDDELGEPNAAESTLHGMIWLTAPFAVIHAVSAVMGYRWAGQCNTLRDRAAR